MDCRTFERCATSMIETFDKAHDRTAFLQFCDKLLCHMLAHKNDDGKSQQVRTSVTHNRNRKEMREARVASEDEKDVHLHHPPNPPPPLSLCFPLSSSLSRFLVGHARPFAFTREKV